MLILLLLLTICGISVAGIYYIYDRSESDEDTKKLMTMFLVVIVLMSATFLVYDSQTRQLAFGGEPEWGYSPYNENWGGTGPEDDFDFDGIKNAWDQDADNDEVWDSFEYLTRFNPYQPDLGIDHLGFQWHNEHTLEIKVFPVERLYATQCTVVLFRDSIEIERKTIGGEPVDFYLDVDPDVIYMIDVKLEDLNGVQALYANKANDFFSYTMPGPMLIEFGQWYFDIENQIEGVIRNLRLFGIPNPAVDWLENSIRGLLAAIPLFGWIALIVAIVILVVVHFRRKQKGKPPLLSIFKKPPPKYEKGTVRIEKY